mgnify:CR=1 FL=1
MKISTITNEFGFLKKSSIKASEGKESGLYPFFTSSDVKRLSIDSFLVDDEVIILGTGGMPSCNYYCGKVAYSTDNIVLKSKGRVLTKWLYYFLRRNNLEILANGFHGAGLKHIGKEYVSNIKMPLLSIDEQKHQIRQLDIIYNNINSLNKQMLLCEELVKSRFIGREIILCC